MHSEGYSMHLNNSERPFHEDTYICLPISPSERRENNLTGSETFTLCKRTVIMWLLLEYSLRRILNQKIDCSANNNNFHLQSIRFITSLSLSLVLTSGASTSIRANATQAQVQQNEKF